MKKKRHRFSGTAAFSLSEVTIAMGIVAVLMLPALAMLAGGGSMEALSRDRETASRIARMVVSSARVGETGDNYRIDFPGGGTFPVDLPGRGGMKTAYLLFDEKGLFLGEIEQAGYETGVDPAGGGFHLVRLHFSAHETKAGLYEWDLSVEHAAAAPREVRHAELFQTRLTDP